MQYNNRHIQLNIITDKMLIDLFNESDRIISNYIDNLRPLRNKDIQRLKTLRSFYFQCLFSNRISDKFKDYCEIEIEKIDEVI